METPVSQIAAAIFAAIERSVFEGRLGGGMIVLAADGLRIKLAQDLGDEIADTEFPLAVQEIAKIDPAMYHEYASAMVAGGVRLLESEAKKAQAGPQLVR